MSVPRPIHHSDGETSKRTILRWSIAGVFVVALHGGAVYAALNWPHEAIVASDPPAAIMIELAPLPVAPDMPQQDIALGPQAVAAQAATPSEQEDKPVEPEKTEPEVKPEVKTKIEVPPLPEKPKPEAVLAQTTPPESQQDKPKDKPKKEKRKPDKPKKSERKPQDRTAQDSPVTAAPQAANARRAVTNAAPMAGMSSSVSQATWHSMIMALLNRNKRQPPGGGRGTATVAFSIDRSGRVLSARLAGSSGSAALDQEAVALTHRVSPVPPPPPNIGNGGSILLAVPVSFGE